MSGCGHFQFIKCIRQRFDKNTRFYAMIREIFHLLPGAGTHLEYTPRGAVKPFVQIGEWIGKFFLAVKALDFEK